MSRSISESELGQDHDRAPLPDAPRMTRLQVAETTVVVIEEHSLPIVRFLVALRHGAGHDPDGASGLARLMLELALRGTERRSRRELHDTLEELGSSLYAATSHETGLLRGSSLTRHLDKTIALGAEALSQPAFDPEEQRRLIDETIAGLRAARDDDDSVAETFLRRALFAGHPFARSPAGEIRDLARLETSSLRRLYTQRIAREEIIFGLAGDVTPEAAARLVEEFVADIPPLLPEPVPDLADQPNPVGTRILVVDKPSRTQTQLRIGRLICDGRSPSALPFWLGAVAFGDTFTSPFTREVREVRGWSYGASASFDRRRRHRAPLVLRTAPAFVDAFDCLDLELVLYRGLAAGELADEAIERARSYLLGRHPFALATAADMLAPAVVCELLGLPLNELTRFPELLAAVDRHAVRATMQELLDPNDLHIVMVAPAERAVPILNERFAGVRVDVIDFRDGLELTNR